MKSKVIVDRHPSERKRQAEPIETRGVDANRTLDPSGARAGTISTDAAPEQATA